MDGSRRDQVGALLTAALGLVASASFAAECHGPGAVRHRALVELLERGGHHGAPMQSIAELLPRLPPEMRENFTLVYDSRSPDAVSMPRQIDPLHPRIILFSADGRELLAFTGAPAGPAHEVVESIHYCDEERRFAFSRFALGGAERPQPAHDVQENPPECLRCHGADPRPIVDSYPLWPGFYGSIEDHLIAGSTEDANYRRFQRTVRADRHSLYRLLRFPKGSEVAPYHVAGSPSDTENDDLTLAPNTRLGMALTELNRTRIARQLEASPHYQEVQRLVIASLLGCVRPPIASLDRAWMTEALESEDRARVLRLGSLPASVPVSELHMQELTSLENLAQIDWVARVLQVDRSDWAMAMEPGSLGLFDGILSSDQEGRDFYLKEDLINVMLARLAQDDPALRPYFRTYQGYRYPFGKRLDLDLALRACPLLGAGPPPTWPSLGPRTVAAPDRWAAERCLACHDPEQEGPDGAPPIPLMSATQLDRPSRGGRSLRDEIRARLAVGAEHPMPPGEPLPAVEREALERYLDLPGSR